MRGWTWIDEDSENTCDCGGEASCESCQSDLAGAMKRKIKMEMIQKLAAEWNSAHTAIEQRGWRSREDRYEEEDYHSERMEECVDNAVYEAEQANPFLSEEEKEEIRQREEKKYRAEVELEESKIPLKRQAIEELLEQLGVRMMRPYEHWNEEERYMEYMETRYDSYDNDIY